MSNNSKHKQNKRDRKKVLIIIVAAVALIAFGLGMMNFIKTGSKTADSKVVKNSDIVIPVNELTEQVSFYPAEIDGTKLEIMAVKASDGSIRTAFNTCQICFSSGSGYYEQEGNQLVCQNCGNRFGMDDVEVTRGGCNPVPITSENKTVNDETITISQDFLLQAKSIFANWK